MAPVVRDSRAYGATRVTGANSRRIGRLTPNEAIELFGYGGLVPALTSLVAALLGRRLLPASASERYAAAVALVAGFAVGYALLPAWAAPLPTRYWHWLPYLGGAAMIVGPVGQAVGVSRLERGLVQLLFALVAAWLLVPTWADLQPSRPVWIALLTAYLFLLAALLEPLAKPICERRVLAFLTLAATSSAIMVAVFVSLKFGRVAGVAAASVAGCWAAQSVARGQLGTPGFLPAYSALVGGSAFTGAINPAPPNAALLLVPAGPIALWLFVRGPLARFQGIAAWVAQFFVVVALLAAFLFLAMYWESGGQEGF